MVHGPSHGNVPDDRGTKSGAGSHQGDASVSEISPYCNRKNLQARHMSALLGTARPRGLHDLPEDRDEDGQNAGPGHLPEVSASEKLIKID